MKPIFYLFGYIFPILATTTLFFKGWTLLTLPVVAFVIIPLLEFALTGTTYNADEKEKKANATLYDVLIYGLVPLHICVMICLMYLSSIGHFSNALEMAGAIFHSWYLLWNIWYQHSFTNSVIEPNPMSNLCPKLFC